VIDRAVLLCTGDEIRAEHLPGEKMVPLLPARPSRLPAPSEDELEHADMPTSRIVLPEGTSSPSAANLERDRVLAALDECAGNQTHAARLLGISRGTLIARIQQYDIRRPRKR
jgi:DNA-binding NtrC family response regulator